jgi:carbon-monoxide dehydrogenase small subunit
MNSSGRREFSFVVNGKSQTVVAYAMERLLDVLRRDLGLTGTKEGCGEGECGACSVLIDGELVTSCLVPVAQVEAADVVTIEGVASHACSQKLQESFLHCGGAQCGICTPGMILAAVHLLDKNPSPTRAEISEALAGNLCRCTGYVQILEAVEQAARSGVEA